MYDIIVAILFGIYGTIMTIVCITVVYGIDAQVERAKESTRRSMYWDMIMNNLSANIDYNGVFNPNYNGEYPELFKMAAQKAKWVSKLYDAGYYIPKDYMVELILCNNVEDFKKNFPFLAKGMRPLPVVTCHIPTVDPHIKAEHVSMALQGITMGV